MAQYMPALWYQGWSLRRLLYRLDPAPSEHELSPLFALEARASMESLALPILLATGCFLAFFALTDYLLYPSAFWPLLGMRVTLVGICWLTAAIIHWVRGRVLIYPLFAGSTAIFWIIIALMLTINRDPTGLYGVTFMGSIAMMCMLPWPVPWLVVALGSLTAIYTFIVAVPSGPAVAVRVWFFDLGLLASCFLFGLVHWHLRRLRWESFLNRQRVQILADKLQEHTDRLQGELQLARQVQQQLLPPARPAWDGLDVVCHSVPAHDVGGDFYAHYAFPDGRVVLAVGDISGKGLPAALLMSLSLATFQSLVPAAGAPGRLLAELDRAIEPHTETTHQFCALCCADLSGLTLRAANAGCIPPIVRRTSSIERLDVAGVPLGVGLGAATGYREAVSYLVAGDLVIFTSDGVVEAMNAAGELFGFARLEEAIVSGPASSAQALLDHLLAEVNSFVGGADPHDDLTIVVIQIHTGQLFDDA